MTAHTKVASVAVATSSGSSAQRAQRRISLREHAKAHGWEVLTHLDGAPDVILEGATAADVDLLLVSSLGDLGKGVEACSRALLELLARGIEVRSLAEPWFSTHVEDSRNLVTALLAWQVQQAEALRGAKVRDGQRRARAQGAKIGRPRKYVNVEHARALIEGGATVSDAARAVGCSRSHLKRALASAPPARATPLPTGTARSSTAPGPLAQRVLEIAGDPFTPSTAG